MHGIMFAELQRHVETTLGPDVWDSLLVEAEIPTKIYLPVTSYPDEEFFKLIGAAAARAGHDAQNFIEALGEAMTPGLITTYSALVNPAWKTLDFIENTGTVVHTIVKRNDANVNPPDLVSIRVSPTELLVSYASERKMCRLARGLIRGVANHYHEKILLVEEACMLADPPAPKCTFRITVSGPIRRASTSGFRAVKP